MTENPTDNVTRSETASATHRRWVTLLVGCIIVLIVLAGVGWAVYGLLQSGELTAQIRDIFIIFMALESLLIGIALIILIIQIASLINLIQNEVRPILEATSETVTTLRGTTAFLSEKFVEPVIKLNSYLAGFRRIFDLFGLIKRK